MCRPNLQVHHLLRRHNQHQHQYLHLNLLPQLQHREFISTLFLEAFDVLVLNVYTSDCLTNFSASRIFELCRPQSTPEPTTVEVPPVVPPAS